jgi:hypothetical protein
LLILTFGNCYTQEVKYVIVEYDALTSFYNSLDGPNWKNKIGWPVQKTYKSGESRNPTGVSFKDTVSVFVKEENAIIYYLSVSRIVLDGELKGILPKVNFENLIELDLRNCEIKSGIENLLAPKLEKLLLINCSIVQDGIRLSYPKLGILYLNNNKISGLFDNSELPNLQFCDIQNNLFNQLLEIKAYSPKLKTLYAIGNELLPDELEKNLSINTLWGQGQLVKVDLPKFERNDSTFIHFPKVPGEYNIYTWQSYAGTYEGKDVWQDKNNYKDTIKGKTSMSWATLRVKISNSKLPNYEIYTYPNNYVAPTVQCWENEYFKICCPTGGFTESESGVLSTNKSAIINDFINLDGNIVLDPSKLELNINGRIYVKEIPLFSGGIGEITLTSGEYKLSLLGKDGKITNFINGLAAELPDIGGFQFKIKELELVGGKNPIGIKFGAVFELKNVTKACSDKTDPDEDVVKLEILGIELSRTKGWEISGMKLENFGLMPNFCVKEINFNANNEKNTITMGALFKTPFIEIGAGFGLLNGGLDSIGLMAEVEKPVIPLGTTLALYGALGALWNIQAAETWRDYNFKIGGIIGPNFSKDLLMFKAVIGYDAPNVIFGIEEANFFKYKDHNEDEQWIATGSLMGKSSSDLLKIGLDGDLKIGPYKPEKDDDTKYIFNSTVNLAYKTDVDIFTGKIKGELTVPKVMLNKNPVSDWLNTKFGLPYTAKAEAFMLYKETAKYINGSFNVSKKLGDITFVVNLTQYGTDNFLIFKFEQLNLGGIISKDLPDILAKSHSFEIPDNTGLAFVYVNGENPEKVTLTDPNNKNYSVSTLGNNIEFDKNSSDNTSFWTLILPAKGNWKVNYEDGQTVEVYSKYISKSSLEINPAETSENVNITWTSTNIPNSAEIDFYIDTDNDGINGYYIGSTSIGSKSYSFKKNVSEGLCSFYVYATTNVDDEIIFKYSDKPLSAKMGVAAPTNIKLEYSKSLNILDIKFDLVNDINIAGYVIKYCDNQETIRSFYSNQNSARVYLNNFDVNREIELVSISKTNNISCPTKPMKVTVGTNESLDISNKDCLVFPNPFSTHFTVKGNENQNCTVQVVDLQGHILLENSSNNSDILIYGDKFNVGIYFVKVTSANESKIFKIIKVE